MVLKDIRKIRIPFMIRFFPDNARKKEASLASTNRIPCSVIPKFLAK